MSRSLFAELRRRNVFKAGAAYLALGWVVVQVTATVVPALNLPATAVPIVTWIGVIGFPFVILFSWIYELTPEGLKRESEVDRSASITHVTGRRLDYTIIALLVVAIGLFAFHEFRGGQKATDANPGAPESTQAASSPTTAQPGAPSASAAKIPDAATGAIPEIDKDPSIAVLPLINMSEDKNNEYFSDGISEELLNLLAQVPKLRVIARTSSFAFKGEKVDLGDVARKLHVASILEGSVRKAGDTVRITVQLIRASDSSHLWSEDYDRKLTDVFKVQDEIAAAVVEQLKIKLLPNQQVTNARRTANTEAHNQYLLGNQFYNRGTADGYHRAVTAYRQATTLDPGFAAAFAGLAYAEAYAADSANTTAEIAAGQQRALAAADKAIALAPDLADGYAARGTLRASITWGWAGAQTDFERALALDPGNSTAQRRYGNLLWCVGRAPEAIAATRKAIELDPLSSGAWGNLGAIHIYNGQFPEAREALNRAIAINPESNLGNYYSGLVELLEGHVQEALTPFHRAGEPFSQVGIAMAEHTLGHAQESQQVLDELTAKFAHDAAYQIADVYGWRGEADKTFEWLDRAYAQHDGGVSVIKGDPLLRSVRGDPRFAAMLKKLGLPP
jgi:TolB-like protein/Tfp pilus assembly protein PilF